MNRFLVGNPDLTHRLVNKHFELRHHYIRSEVAKGNIAMVEVATADQVADIFTKTLARPAFEKHAAALMEGLPTMFAGTSDWGGELTYQCHCF